MVTITPASSKNNEEALSQGFDALHSSEKEIFDALYKARFPEDRKDYNFHSDDGTYPGGDDIYTAEMIEERIKRKEREKLAEAQRGTNEENTTGAEDREKQINDIKNIKVQYKNIVIKKGKNRGIIDKSGNRIASPNFDFIEFISDGLAKAKQGKNRGIIDKKGRWVIKPGFEDVGSFYDGFAKVNQGGNRGFIDTSGRWVIKPGFEDVGSFYDGFARANQGGNRGIIDTSGNIIVPCIYDGIYMISNNNTLEYFIALKDGEVFEINKRGSAKKIVI